MRHWLSAVTAVGLCLAALFGLAVVPGSVAAAGPTPVTVGDLAGTGMPGDPYVVTNASELQAINQSLDADYRLGGDIDASETAVWAGGSGFVPIGNASSHFTGSFDGSDYRIEDLVINRSAASPGTTGGDAALFGAANGATISNVTLMNATMAAGNSSDVVSIDGPSGGAGGNASGLVAVADTTTITGVSVVGATITAGVGGDGGSGTTGSNGGDGGTAGGVVALATGGAVSESTVIGSTVDGGTGGTGGFSGVTSGGWGGDGGSAGGIVGYSDGTTLREVAATGLDVTGGAGGAGGGADGYPDGVSGTDGATGGALGVMQGGTLTETYTEGMADGGVAVGGLVGKTVFSGTIRNASAAVATNGSSNVGGLVGEGTVASLYTSFATGSVTGTTGVGGLVGSASLDTIISDAYWNTDSTGQASATGSSQGVGGLSTGQMTGSSPQSSMSELDFTSMWVTTDSYPQLQWTVEDVTLAVEETTISDGGSTAAGVTLSLVDGSTVSATIPSVITSTDSEILSTDGSVVVAVGTGTAQVYTTVAGITDSVTVTVEASEEGETESNDDTGGSSGSSGGSSGGSDDNDGDGDSSTTTVTAVKTTDGTTEDSVGSDEGTGDEAPTDDSSSGDDTVRVSSASASVRAGSTLSITLPPTTDADTDDQEPTDGEEVTDEGAVPGDESTDDEAEQPPEGGPTDPDDTGGAAGDTDPNDPPPPPVSQAEIESVEIDVSEDVEAEVEIRQSRSPPREDAAEFQRDDGTQPAGYIEVTDNLDDEQVTEGRISFRISTADLETDQADPENVALYHYVPETGEWEELDTEVLGETDDGYVRFRGTTPGFSQFATGIKRAQFEISDALVDVQEVTLGDSIQVEAIVTNTGGADGTFTAQLLVDSDIVAEDVLTIASGGQRATIFDHEFTAADTYEVRVNDISTGEIQVTDPNAASADSTDDFLPGFGFGATVASLAVSALLYRRRIRG